MHKHLLTTRRSQALYDYFAKGLDHIGLIETDHLVLAMIANQMDEYITLSDEIQEEGSTITTSRGQAKNPKISVRDGSFDKIYRLMRETGLTPSSRKKLIEQITNNDMPNLEDELHL